MADVAVALRGLDPALVEQIIEYPSDRTHFVSPWIPQYQVRGAGKTPRTTISPCHGWVHVRVINERLHLHMFQRSGDVPVGVPSVAQSCAPIARGGPGIVGSGGA